MQVAQYQTTAPEIADGTIVVLTDDKGLFSADNIVPVLRKALADAYGTKLSDAINALERQDHHRRPRGLEQRHRREEGRPGRRRQGLAHREGPPLAPPQSNAAWIRARSGARIRRRFVRVQPAGMAVAPPR